MPRRHAVSAIIGTDVDPFRRRYINYESGLERRWLHVLMASPLVDCIWEQQRLDIRMKDGSLVTHFFDFVVSRTDGSIHAYACKYERDIRPKLTDLLERAGETVGDAFADEYSILSEVGLSEIRVWNARRVVDCAKDFDFPAQQAIRMELPNLGEFVSLATLDAIVNDGQRGSRAGIAMIQQGAFAVPKGERIGLISGLRNLFTK